ncbi:MAG: hypothetical protein E6706_02490, partial [Anaerococcus hydrogenalis]|nr:hypothetical protein [Anaerococcus hydrogenalis]
MKKIIELKSIEQENFHKNVNYFVDTIKNILKNKEKAYIFTSDEKSFENIKNIFDENNIFNYSTEFEDKDNKKDLVLTDKNLSTGYIFTDYKVNVFSYKDIFGKEKHN